jgi:hypothetical protein
MNALQKWQRCPKTIDIDDQTRSIRLRKLDSRYAIRGALSEPQSRAVESRLADDDISIVRGVPPSDSSFSFELLPVYAISPDLAPIVVTERVFLCLQEQRLIETLRDDINALGFVIDDIPRHAPHCAWLIPKSGRVDDALSKLEGLRALPGAVRAQPQLLRPRGWKIGS